MVTLPDHLPYRSAIMTQVDALNPFANEPKLKHSSNLPLCGAPNQAGYPCQRVISPELGKCTLHGRPTPHCSFVDEDGAQCGKIAIHGEELCRHHKMEKAPCQGRTAKGTACKFAPMNGRDYCWMHDASYRDKRLRDEVEAATNGEEPRGKLTHTSDRNHAYAIIETEKRVENLAESAPVGPLDVRRYRPVDNPYEALLDLAGQAIEIKNQMAATVAYIQTLRYAGATAEQVRGEVDLLYRAMAECRMVLGLIAKIDLENRMVRVAEAQAILVAETLSAVLRHLGLSDDDQQFARAEVARRLRDVGGSARPALASGSGPMG